MVVSRGTAVPAVFSGPHSSRARRPCHVIGAAVALPGLYCGWPFRPADLCRPRQWFPGDDHFAPSEHWRTTPASGTRRNKNRQNFQYRFSSILRSPGAAQPSDSCRFVVVFYSGFCGDLQNLRIKFFSIDLHMRWIRGLSRKYCGWSFMPRKPSLRLCDLYKHKQPGSKRNSGCLGSSVAIAA